MAVPVIVDGYNLLFLDHRNPDQSAREALRNQLTRYSVLKGRTILLVFDGAKGGSGAPTPRDAAGVTVYYSSGKERADDLIRRLVRERREAVVVTSDRDLARSVERLGAAVISSRSFQHRLEQALTPEESSEWDEDDEEGSTEERPGKSRHRAWLKGL